MAPDGFVEAIAVAVDRFTGITARFDGGTPDEFEFECLEARFAHGVDVPISVKRSRGVC